VPYMLVGNTGDMQLMKMLRGRAMEKGLTLNEYGMGQAVRSPEVSRFILCYMPCADLQGKRELRSVRIPQAYV